MPILVWNYVLSSFARVCHISSSRHLFIWLFLILLASELNIWCILLCVVTGRRLRIFSGLDSLTRLNLSVLGVPAGSAWRFCEFCLPTSLTCLSVLRIAYQAIVKDGRLAFIDLLFLEIKIHLLIVIITSLWILLNIIQKLDWVWICELLLNRSWIEIFNIIPCMLCIALLLFTPILAPFSLHIWWAICFSLAQLWIYQWRTFLFFLNLARSFRTWTFSPMFCLSFLFLIIFSFGRRISLIVFWIRTHSFSSSVCNRKT